METQSMEKVLTKIVRAAEGRKLSVLGDSPNIKLSGKDTNGQFTVISQENPPGVGIPMHVHENEDEVFKVLEGEMEFNTNGEISVLGAGDIIFLPRKVPHAFRVIGDKNAKAIITAYPSGIEDMFEQLAELPAGPPDFEKVVAICGKFGVTFL